MNELAPRVEALLEQAFALHGELRLDEARLLYEQALELHPREFRALYLLGVIALQQGRPERAVELLGQAVRAEPHRAEAHNDLGRAQVQLGRCEEAVASFDASIAINPGNAKVHNNRGDALFALERFEAAATSHEAAIALKPDSPAAHFGRGNALFKLMRYEAAVASFDRALALRPGDADAHNNRGNALCRLKKYEAAIASYDRAVALDPGFAGAYRNRGDLFSELEAYEAAIANYDKALALKPGLGFAQGMRLHARMRICDWDDFEAEAARLTARIENDEAAVNPFSLLAMSGSAPLQLKAARIWVREECSAKHALAAAFGRPEQDRMRIGYFSADFHDHATMHLAAGLFEHHDRSRFDVIAFSFGPDSQGEMRARSVAACRRFIDVRHMTDREIAALARSLKIDIAVDLKGFTQDARPGIFALRCAPLQVSYLGYPGTMGAGYIDYLVADHTLVPAASRRHYGEKIIYLPGSYQVNDAARAIADREFTRQELELPPTGFVFCCFNRNYKITPGTFDGWMRILSRVEGSVLWLMEDYPRAAGNLRREAARRNVDAARLIFARRMPPPEHLARHRAADLFIDTLPCNAHTTASDALWTGLLVLTCMGEAFACRVAASLLNAIELPELVASSQEQYEDLAVELAGDARRLAEIRRKLLLNRRTTALFDTAGYTKQIEAAYSRIHSRHQAGLPPEHVTI